MSKQKEFINEYRQQNGNNNFTQKEMILFIMGKVEKIADNQQESSKQTVINKTRLSGLIKILGVFLPFLIGTIVWLFQRTI